MAFLPGVDYCQRKHHRGHAWETREAVRTLLLVRQRLDAHTHTATAAAETRARRRSASRAAREIPNGVRLSILYSYMKT